MDFELKQKLELGIKLPLKAPFLLRLFGKKQIAFSVQPTIMQTSIDVGRIYLTIPRDEKGQIDETIKGLNESANKIARMAALTIMNNDFYGLNWLLVYPFAMWLKNRTSLDKLWLVTSLVLLNGIENYLDVIRLINSTNLMKPNKSN